MSVILSVYIFNIYIYPYNHSIIVQKYLVCFILYISVQFINLEIFAFQYALCLLYAQGLIVFDFWKQKILALRGSTNPKKYIQALYAF